MLKVFLQRYKIVSLGAVLLLLVIGISSQGFAKFCVDTAIKLNSKKVNVSYASYEGGLFSGIVIGDIQISDLKNFKDLSSLKVQDLKFKLSLLPFPNYKLTVNNARLKTGDAEVILINMIFKPNYKNTEIFAQNANIGSLKRFFPDFPEKSTLDGSVKKLDASISKKNFRYYLEAETEFTDLSFKEFKAQDLILKADFNFKDLEEGLHGTLEISRALVQGEKTAQVLLQDSNLKFNGKYKAVELNIKGQARVGNVDINLKLRGNYTEPKLSLNSKPVLPRRALLAMLATNRRWQSLEESFNGQDTQPDIVHGLINYFLFNKQNKFLSEKLAISDLKLDLEEEKQKISVSHDIAKKIDLEYSVEKEKDNPEAPINTRVNLEFETSF